MLSLALVVALAAAEALALQPSARTGTVKLVYLVVESDRFVAADTSVGGFAELRRQAQEELQEEIVANLVIVLATNQRFAAYSALTGNWHIEKTRAGERLLRLEAEDYSALVVTSERLLTFNGERGIWAERRR